MTLEFKIYLQITNTFKLEWNLLVFNEACSILCNLPVNNINVDNGKSLTNCKVLH